MSELLEHSDIVAIANRYADAMDNLSVRIYGIKNSHETREKIIQRFIEDCGMHEQEDGR